MRHQAYLFVQRYLLSAAFCGVVGTAFAHASAPPDKRPNIVVILVDDMGFSDIGCYGSEIPTPNLDKLAATGLRFTQFYNTGRCCPTRAALLTGLYSHQAGMGHMTADRGQDGYRGDLNEHCVTIAEALRPAGYRTYMTGKWHVTKFVQPADEAKKFNWPLQRGFDSYFGIIQGAADYYRPKPLTRDNQIVQPGEGFYTTDAFVDNAVKMIDAGDQAKPFFLYVAFNAPHYPLMAPQEEIAKYLGKYKIGWDELQQAASCEADQSLASSRSNGRFRRCRRPCILGPPCRRRNRNALTISCRFTRPSCRTWTAPWDGSWKPSRSETNWTIP